MCHMLSGVQKSTLSTFHSEFMRGIGKTREYLYLPTYIHFTLNFYRYIKSSSKIIARRAKPFLLKLIYSDDLDLK